MSCLNPITIRLFKGTDKETFQKVRCRQCEDCKQSMRSAAFVRLRAEYDYCMRQHGMCFFFTLTFADEFVPFKFHRMCFDKRLVQNWIDKFRQEFRRKYGYRVKYFLVSELGHVGTHRPHHHGMFFLYKDDKYQLKSWKNGVHSCEIPFFSHSFARIIQDLWIYGRCDISVFDPKKGGIQYVAKYISKFDEEDKLFKDIITRIQLKRGKGKFSQDDPRLFYREFQFTRRVDLPNGDYKFERYGDWHIRIADHRNYDSLYYYAHTFPSLHAFMQRYCPFTMISQGLGSTADLCDECIISQKPIFIDGFQYSIPRYFSDRYVRKEIKAAQQFVVHDADFSDCQSSAKFVKRPDAPSYMKIKHFYSEPYLQKIYRDEWHPIEPFSNVKPSETICEKYKSIDMFKPCYGPMPYYELKFRPNGTQYFRQVLPKQSEVSLLSKKRKEFKFSHILDYIEDKYFSLPGLLQDSCSYDIPQILKDSKDLMSDESALSPVGFDILSELDDLTQVASDWRAKSRLAKIEQKRKEKMARNTPYAKKLLSWEQYRVKSRYFSISKKFKT